MGKFPSQPNNPREYVNAITLRSRKQVTEIERKGMESRAKSEQIQEKYEKQKTDEQEPEQMKTPYLPFLKG